MRQKLIVAAAWACSLVVVYVAARRGVAPAPAGASAAAERSVANLGLDPGRAPGAGVAAPRSAAADVAPAGPAERQPAVPLEEPAAWTAVRATPRDLADALRSKDVVGRNLAIAEIIAGMNKQNAQEVLRAFEEGPRNPETDNYFRLFMAAWGQIDGEAAVRYALSGENARRVQGGGSGAMAAWASADPRSARAFVDGMGEEDRARRYMTEALVRGWSETDLAGASSFVAGLGGGDERNRHIEILTERYLEQRGAEGALDWAEQATRASGDATYAAAVSSRVAFEVSQRDPEAVAAWIDRGMGSALVDKRALGEIAAELGERDPLAAASWLEGHFHDPRFDGQVVAQFAREWAGRDAAAAAGWVEQYLGTAQVSADVVSQVSREWGERDPAAAIAWVGRIDDPEMKSRGLASAVDAWADRDLKAAGEWLSGVERTPLADRAVEAYVNRLARESPEQALLWSQEIVDDERRQRSVVRSAQSLYRRSPELVNQLLPMLNLSEEAQRAIINPRRDWERGGRGRFGG